MIRAAAAVSELPPCLQLRLHPQHLPEHPRAPRPCGIARANLPAWGPSPFPRLLRAVPVPREQLGCPVTPSSEPPGAGPRLSKDPRAVPGAREPRGSPGGFSFFPHPSLLILLPGACPGPDGRLCPTGAPGGAETAPAPFPGVPTRPQLCSPGPRGRSFSLQLQPLPSSDSSGSRCLSRALSASLSSFAFPRAVDASSASPSLKPPADAPEMEMEAN